MNLIVAADDRWGIGKDGKLLVHLSGDLRYFKEKTRGKTVFMGRKTLESLPGGKPLPERTNIVLTSKKDYEKDGCIIVHSEDELLAECGRYPDDDVMCIGGAVMYNRFMEMCDRLYVTRIYGDFDADVFIKDPGSLGKFDMAWKSGINEEKGIRYQFFIYERTERQDDGKDKK